MKTQKKVLALALTLVLAFVMTLSLAVTAFADSEEEAAAKSYTITINNTNKGHTYEAYQIFAGDLSAETTETVPPKTTYTLSNIVWGKNVDTATVDAALAALIPAADEEVEEEDDATAPTADQWAEWLANGKVTAEDFAKAISKCLKGDPAATIEDENKDEEEEAAKYEGTVAEAGYYLIKDQDDSLTGKDDTYTSFILEVVGDVETDPKGDKPTVEKKVKDRNDSTGEATGWQDSADHDIGDTVEFQLTGTLPDNYSDYKSYKYIFRDTLSKGLDVCDEEDFHIYAVDEDGNREDITDSFVITIGEYDAVTGTTIEIKCINLKTVAEVVDETYTIVVEYTATLNDKANIGVAGNPNEVDLVYSNNPNYEKSGEPDEEDEDEPTGETPKDKVIVFTFELEDTKIDGAAEEEGTPLPNVEFELYKWIDYLPDDAEAEEPTYDKKIEPEIPEAWAGDKYEGKDLTPKSEHGYWVKVATITSDDEGKFGYKGLDDGNYVLVETKAPAGYNLADPIYFEITSKHDEEADDPKLTELNVDHENNGMNADKESGKITGEVINNKGSNLPSTGGIGTTIFYIIGGVLVALTSVLLITKSRMKGKN